NQDSFTSRTSCREYSATLRSYGRIRASARPRERFPFCHRSSASLGVLGNKDCVAHLPAGSLVLGLQLFPQLQSAELEVWKLFLDLTPQTVSFGFTGPLTASGKHPQTIGASPHEQNPAALCRNELRRLRHPSVPPLARISEL